MLSRSFVPALAAALLASPVWAASPQVGQEAPDFGNPNWVVAPKGETSIRALRGEVVFVEFWGVKCPPCVALIPHVQKLKDQYGDRGLHIFAFEAQGHTPDQIKQLLASKGHKDYPVAAGGAQGYQTNGGIPHAWLIGVDGKVIWEGNPGGGTVDRLIEQEIAKVRFPGLGRSDFDKAVSKAVQKYMAKDLGGARKEAQKVLDNARSTDEAKADATYLIERVAELGRKQLELAQQNEADRDYLAAMEIYGYLAKTFKGEAEAQQAGERLDALKKDDTAKREIDAAKKLAALMGQLKGRPAAERRAHLERFAADEKHAGTRAAEQASREAAQAGA